MKRFLIILIIFSFFIIGAVSASENLTDDALGSNSTDEMQTPVISLNSSKGYVNQSISISLSDSNNGGLSAKELTVNVDKKKYSLVTDNKGSAVFKLDLKANSYALNVIFKGDDNFAPVNQTFNINVLKLPTSINPVNTTVLKYKYFYVYLKDKSGNPLIDETVSFKVDGKTYKSSTNNKGRAALKVNLNPDAKYSLKISYAGNDYYSSISKTVTLIVPATTSIVIGNDKLLSKGYLRIYLRSDTLSAISKKTVSITVGSKTYKKTTNSEGVIVFKPYLGNNTYLVSADFAGSDTIFSSHASKNVTGVIGSVKDPLKTKIPLVNGVPDIDVMPGHYVMGDGDMKYTLLKEQYRNVLKRDSKTLFLTNKLSKYVIFKTKSEPKIIHVLVREKWNVIERAINTKIVLKNKNNYWPGSITVSLKGKSYTYPQVRDEQNTGYTCGPTSASMCSQVLRNYVCESQFAKLSKTTVADGTMAKDLKKGLEKANFKCYYFYKKTFDKALKQLNKGGCALIFHTWGHYVAILDISKDGKKILIGNPSGDYDYGSHDIPTKWVTVNFMKGKFNNYDTTSIVVKLKHSLSSIQKTKLKNLYSTFGSGWTAQNTLQRIPQIGK
ncbi:cysteine peptidase family C39 domain-containing protein [Methanobrevibacter sp.]|uniref:cysteine peptidase family C39 domain-containing protein n=1 Tax=Methanobrevibacter sp. TaxID=66852 RepID=UPI00388F0BC8